MFGAPAKKKLVNDESNLRVFFHVIGQLCDFFPRDRLGCADHMKKSRKFSSAKVQSFFSAEHPNLALLVILLLFSGLFC